MSRRALSGVAVFLLSVSCLLYMLFSDRPWLILLWTSTKVLYIAGLSGLALWLVLSRLFGAARADSALVNICMVMAASIFTLIAAELSLRIAFRDVTTTGDNLSYFSMHWGKNVHYNSWGFREREFELEKPRGLYRIAVVGDSLAFGQGIAEEERFSNVLQTKLNGRSGRSYQVLNFALPGAETTDELGFLTRAVLDSKPDYILLQWYINDVQGDDKRDAPHPLTIIPPDLRRGSVLFYIAHRVLGDIQSRLGWTRSYDQYMTARFGAPNSQASLKAAAAMNTFIEICRKFDIPLGMVLFSESYFDPGSRLDFLLERMLEVCKEQRLRCLDTRIALLPLQGDRKLWASRFDPHPSAFANRLVADRLLATFGDTWSR